MPLTAMDGNADLQKTELEPARCSESWPLGVGYVEDLLKAYRWIKKELGPELVWVDNRFSTPTAFGYLRSLIMGRGFAYLVVLHAFKKGPWALVHVALAENTG